MPESAVEHLERVLERVRVTEPHVNAYSTLDETGARRAVSAVSSAAPLHGMCFGVKEVIAVAGMPATAGSSVLSGEPTRDDANVVRRLRDAGAVFVGMQVSNEFTCGLDKPVTRNPWDLARYPGGSSAGAGVSVAVGSADFALGTDAAGSVRIPAAMTGVVGLKPTAGLVSMHGVLRTASAPSIDTIGITGASVADVARVFDVVRGPDAADATTLQHHGTSVVDVASVDSEPGKLRVGMLADRTRAALTALSVSDPEVDACFLRACAGLEAAGFALKSVEIGCLVDAVPAVATLFSAELAVAHADLLERHAGKYHPSVRAMLTSAVGISQESLDGAVATRQRLRMAMRAAFDEAGIDLLITPTTPRVAMDMATYDPGVELASLIPYTCAFNLTGQPAISVPCGFVAGGLPVGLQVVGRPWGESGVLALAGAYERQTEWDIRRPPLKPVSPGR